MKLSSYEEIKQKVAQRLLCNTHAKLFFTSYVTLSFSSLRCSQFVQKQNCCEDLLLNIQVIYIISHHTENRNFTFQKSCTRRLYLPGNTELLQLPYAFNLQSSTIKSCCHYSHMVSSDVHFLKKIPCHLSLLRM